MSFTTTTAASAEARSNDVPGKLPETLMLVMLLLPLLAAAAVATQNAQTV